MTSHRFGWLGAFRTTWTPSFRLLGVLKTTRTHEVSPKRVCAPFCVQFAGAATRSTIQGNLNVWGWMCTKKISDELFFISLAETSKYYQAFWCFSRIVEVLIGMDIIKVASTHLFASVLFPNFICFFCSTNDHYDFRVHLQFYFLPQTLKCIKK